MRAISALRPVFLALVLLLMSDVMLAQAQVTEKHSPAIIQVEYPSESRDFSQKEKDEDDEKKDEKDDVVKPGGAGGGYQRVLWVLFLRLTSL